MGVLIWILPSSNTSGKLCPLPDTRPVCFLIIRPTTKKKFEAKGCQGMLSASNSTPAANRTFETQTARHAVPSGNDKIAIENGHL